MLIVCFYLNFIDSTFIGIPKRIPMKVFMSAS